MRLGEIRRRRRRDERQDDSLKGERGSEAARQRGSEAARQRGSEAAGEELGRGGVSGCSRTAVSPLLSQRRALPTPSSSHSFFSSDVDSENTHLVFDVVGNRRDQHLDVCVTLESSDSASSAAEAGRRWKSLRTVRCLSASVTATDTGLLGNCR